MERRIAARAVADACALAIVMDQGLEHLLPKAFGCILVPRHVYVELRRRGPKRRAQLRRLFRDGVLTHCLDYREDLVAHWHAAVGFGGKPTRNRGEAEALAQCQSQDADALFTTDHAALALATTIRLQAVTVEQFVAAVGAR